MFKESKQTVEKTKTMREMEMEVPARISAKEEKRCFDLRKPLNKTILSLAVTMTFGLIIAGVIIIVMPKKG